MKVKDKVKSIIDAQQDKGLSKYGVYVDEADLTAEEWIEHAQEELADMMVYLEYLKRKISKRLIEKKNCSIPVVVECNTTVCVWQVPAQNLIENTKD